MNHTPGPWKNDSMKFSAGWRCVVNLPGGRSIDVADPRNRATDDEDVANAELISQAPTLSEKLRIAEVQINALREERDRYLTALKEIRTHRISDSALMIIDGVVADKPKCICGGVGLGVVCEAGCPNYKELPKVECEFDHTKHSDGREWCAGCGVEIKR